MFLKNVFRHTIYVGDSKVLHGPPRKVAILSPLNKLMLENAFALGFSQLPSYN